MSLLAAFQVAFLVDNTASGCQGKAEAAVAALACVAIPGALARCAPSLLIPRGALPCPGAFPRCPSRSWVLTRCLSPSRLPGNPCPCVVPAVGVWWKGEMLLLCLSFPAYFSKWPSVKPQVVMLGENLIETSLIY